MKKTKIYCVVHKIMVDDICLLCDRWIQPFQPIEHVDPDYSWDDTNEFIESL